MVVTEEFAVGWRRHIRVPTRQRPETEADEVATLVEGRRGEDGLLLRLGDRRNATAVVVGGHKGGIGIAGQDAGVQNDPVNPLTERERLLSHLVFAPVLKSANRTLTVTYSLTIAVARTT